MALIFRGKEFVTTDPLDANALAQLVGLAARRPLKINGVEYSAQELEALASEARRTNQKISLGSAAHVTSPHDADNISETHKIAPHVHAQQMKILAHATKVFSAPDVSDVNSDVKLTQSLREFLKIENRRLRFAAQLGASGRELAALRAFALDISIANIFRLIQRNEHTELDTDASASLAVVALGGYGRGELAPFSDVDILFLHAERPSARVRENISQILPMLWDARLDVGNFNYSTNECLTAAHTDAHLQTALMSARLIAGRAELFNKLINALEQKRLKKTNELFTVVENERAERYRKITSAVNLLEPHIKDGAGGLRDLHAALWAANARWGATSLDELRAREIITVDELLRAARAYDFLWRVRFELHWLTGRKTDRLTLDLQPSLAAKFNYRASPYLLASEQFMREYYRRAGELHDFCARIIARAANETTHSFNVKSSPAHQSKTARLFNLVRPKNRAVLDTPTRETFLIRDGRLHLDATADTLAHKPSLLFEAIMLAQSSGVPLSYELHENMRVNLHAIDRKFRQSNEAAQIFLEMLRRRGRVGRALRLMHETNLLNRYLPEFARINLLIQHDLYHQYTIDEHTFRVVEALDDLENGISVTTDKMRAVLLQKSFDEIEDVALLHLGALLHDLGKGRGRGHIARGTMLAKNICARLNLDAASASKVVRLVANHVLMAHVSQRRDLTEPNVVKDFAAQIGNMDELNMLFLLTYADMRGVGAGVWNEWKGALLCELYTLAREHLTGDAPNKTARANDKRLLIEAIVREFEALPNSKVESRKTVARELSEHFAHLPELYAHATSAHDIALHLQLVRALQHFEATSNEQSLICNWHTGDAHTKKQTTSQLSTESGTTKLTVVARDRRGLFADLAGALTAKGVEILSADLNTRNDRIVLDTFILREAARGGAIEEHRRAGIEDALHEAIEGTLDVATAVEKWRTHNAPRRQKLARAGKVETWRRRLTPQITCSNDISASKTVVEVQVADEHGLAYKIARTLTELNLDISRAKIATERSDALDVFYVTTAQGAKLSASEIEILKTTLARELSTIGASVTTPTQHSGEYASSQIEHKL